MIYLALQDVEVTSPPDDSISCLAFSPPTMPGNFLIGGSWANDVSYMYYRNDVNGNNIY